jgi:hypothetical protein
MRGIVEVVAGYSPQQPQQFLSMGVSDRQKILKGTCGEVFVV